MNLDRADLAQQQKDSAMKTYHPRTNDEGAAVELKQPHQPMALMAWDDPNQLATVTPDSPMPDAVAGLAITPWSAAPASSAGWEQLAAAMTFAEPPMKSVPGRLPASGAVVVEPDGRVWVVSPSNRHGGYSNTFPKGKNEHAQALCLRANALKEVFEEAGLQVALTDFLCDSVRSTTVTRYYLARRLGGNPADMCWETQAVHLVPAGQLAAFVSHPNDQSILTALQNVKL
jgi:ADP-ribose pyrophosphatase YjhB (NUDIX family)